MRYNFIHLAIIYFRGLVDKGFVNTGSEMLKLKPLLLFALFNKSFSFRFSMLGFNHLCGHEIKLTGRFQDHSGNQGTLLEHRMYSMIGWKGWYNNFSIIRSILYICYTQFACSANLDGFQKEILKQLKHIFDIFHMGR